MLAGQVMRKVETLDLESLRAFAPMLVELRFHERPGVVDRLNTVFKRKLHAYKAPDLVLYCGLSLLLCDVMKTTTLALWLLRLADMEIPITLMPSGGSGGGATWRDVPADARRVTANLEALKLAEMCLRHERSSTLATLPPKALHLLSLARETPLEPPEDYEMLELPFVFAEPKRLLQEAGLLLHPTLYGPYLLELSDPLGRVAVEWDASWTLYPPWRRARHKEYVTRKHAHLRAEGWRLLCLPLAEFQALEGREARAEHLRRFAERHDLGYLRFSA